MLKAALQMIFPEQCPLCSELVESQGGLCGSCWTETPFIHGTVCNACGAPEIGPSAGDEVICDSCRAHPRPWRAGRSVLRYSGGGRRLVLALKHSDRLDLVPTLAHWMAERAKLYATPGSVVVPVPCHWRRLLQRRYNQAAALARPIAAELGMTYCPDALWRPRATQTQDHMTTDERFTNLSAAIAPTPHGRIRLAGRSVLLIDDVMTSGATLTASALAAKDAGADDISVITLARAVPAAYLAA